MKNLFLFIFFILLSSSFTHASVLSSAAASLAVGSWVEITTTSVTLLGPTANNGNIGEFANTGVWDPVGQKVYFCGASHHSTFDSICAVYSESTNTWTSFGLPAGLVATGGTLEAGNTWGHAYSHNAFDPVRGVFYMRAFNGQTIYKYTISTGVWSTTASPPPLFGCLQATALLEFFPDQDALLFFTPACGGFASYYDPPTDSWGYISPLTGYENDGGYGTVGAYSKTGFIYFGAGINFPYQMYRLSPAITLTRRADFPNYGSVTAAIFTADPVSGVPLQFAAGGGNIWAYNNTANTWSDTGVISKIYPGIDNAAFAVPISTHGVIMMVAVDGGQQSRVWLYKHTASSSPIDDNCVITGKASLQGKASAQ